MSGSSLDSEDLREDEYDAGFNRKFTFRAAESVLSALVVAQRLSGNWLIEKTLFSAHTENKSENWVLPPSFRLPFCTFTD